MKGKIAMSEPTKEQVEKWRSEFESWIKEPVEHPADIGKNSNGEYIDYVTYLKWQGYLAGKKSDFEKISKLENDARVNANRENLLHDLMGELEKLENEIKTLKEQLAEAVDVIRKCRNHNYLGGEAFLDRITEQFLEKQDKENKDEK